MTNVLKLATGTEIDVSRETAKAVSHQIVEVFEFWKSLLSNARSRLDQERRKKIAERLRDGYTVEDLKFAVIGCSFSPYHQGMNDSHTRYQDIELICRHARHVDKFIEIAEREAEKIMAERARKSAHESREPVSEEGRAKLDALMASLKARKRA